VLVDEKNLWPGGRFVTTHLIVRTDFLEKYPDTVSALLRAHVRSVELAEQDAQAAKQSVNAGLDAAGGKSLSPEVLDRAWSELTVTDDPVAPALKQSAENGFKAGTTAEQVDLDGIYDLRLLNGILADEGRESVSAGGLGAQ
jgi:NitT/TauT family transport system substrate-binding protein